MTANKKLKHLVKERAARTGESYQAARRQLLAKRKDNHQVTDDDRRVEFPEEGFIVRVPSSWAQMPADKKNSPAELARFWSFGAEDTRGCLVFRNQHHSGTTSLQAAKAVEEALTAGFSEFTYEDFTVAGRPGTVMTFLQKAPWPNGKQWRVVYYFALDTASTYILGYGSTAMDQDRPLFDRLASQFQLLPSTLENPPVPDG